jgi:hypothetical protein
MPTIHPIQRTNRTPAAPGHLPRESVTTTRISEGHALAKCECGKAVRVSTVKHSRTHARVEIGGSELEPLYAPVDSTSSVTTYTDASGEWLGLDVYAFQNPCACGRPLTFSAIRGRMNAEIKCNAKCTGAKGHDCECSCGGKNHGGKWGG